ncbi:MAG: galactokinase [Sphaerochaetaceae bacterium]|nr:galactokinase [Sphaerochaetaceae bacterium]
MFTDRLIELYGTHTDIRSMKKRYREVLQSHGEHPLAPRYRDSALFSTAGRTELGGNHTDHNRGRVIAASIQLDTIATASTIEEPTVTIVSPGFPDVSIDITDLSVREEEEGTTDALVRGIAHAFSRRNLRTGGLVIHTHTNVLKGSGLSSSAAIEVLIATVFNSLYNDDALSPVELAIIGQYAENEFFGKPSGLMDQIACAVGNVVKIDFQDPVHPVVETIDVDFLGAGYQLMVIDTRGDHSDLTGDYAAIPSEMKSVAAYFNREVLREVTLDEFTSSLKDLRSAIGNDRAVLRAFHFLKENQRVDEMHQALRSNDIESYLDAVRASGQSSYQYLQNVYSSSHPYEQAVSIALAMCSHLLGGDGAFRVHGGGFAGTIQVYVPLSLVSDFTGKIEEIFGTGSVTPLTVRALPTTRVDR